jgi:ribosomal protein S18 acetylase RimI-like enzyme
VTVRRARPEDAAAIAEVHVRTWQAAYAHVFGAERLATLDATARTMRWREIIAGDEQTVLVAEEDGRLVGWCTVGGSRDVDAEGELWGIYVAPEGWGGGAGPALLQAGLAQLRVEGRRDAILWVLEDNPRARRFYEREGWQLDGGRREGEHLGVVAAEVRYRIAL